MASLRKDTKQLIAALAVVFSFVFVPVSAKANSCSLVFVDEPSTYEVLKFAEVTQLRRSSLLRDVARQLVWRSKSFRDRLGIQSLFLPLIPSIQLERALKEHHKAFFAQYRSPRLVEQMRDQSLRENLEHRGYPHEILPGQGRATLERLSKENVGRIRAQFNVETNYRSDPEISAMIDGVQFGAIRNSKTDIIQGGSVVSSREIARYGLMGGLNSLARFNRKLLKSDNDVFFYYEPYRSRPENEHLENEFGDHRFNLDSRYAEMHGWVSPFIMHPKELTKAIRLAFPSAVNTDAIQYDRHGDFRNDSDATNLIRKLHHLDMTVPDFQALVRDQLGTVLYRLKNDRSQETRYGVTYSQAQNDLRFRGLSGRFSRVVEKFVYAELGLQRPELKIPVVVPSTVLRKND